MIHQRKGKSRIVRVKFSSFVEKRVESVVKVIE